MNNTNILVAHMDFWESFVDTRGRAARPPDPARPPNMPIPAFQDMAQIPSGSTWRPPPFPYITYTVVSTDFADTVQVAVNIWDRTQGFVSNYAMIDDVVDQIERRIPAKNGTLLAVDGGGYILLRRGSSWYNRLSGGEQDIFIARGILNVEITNFIV